MQKAKMQTEDGVQENIAKIKRLFPHCVTEARGADGRLTYKIDKELLLQELSGELIEEGEERYCLNWPGKKESLLTANKAIDKTLRPIDAFSQHSTAQHSTAQQPSSDALAECGREKAARISSDLFGDSIEAEQDNLSACSGGINFATTENVFIEGDNLDALKLLNYTYQSKLNLIYIDPPYNMGKDYIYKDNLTIEEKLYLQQSAQLDEYDNRLFSNTESNGRFHSDWLSFIYPRLKLARNLLSNDGVIFIQIDENEQHNLRKICDEIFGAENFIGDIIRKTKSQTNDAKNGLNYQQDFVLIYARDKDKACLIGSEKDISNYKNPDNDPMGDWIIDNPSARSGGENSRFPIKNPYTGREDLPPKGRYWAFSRESFAEWVKSGKIKFRETYKETERGFIVKKYLSELKSAHKLVDSLFGVDNSYMNQVATKEQNEIFGDSLFSYPKPLAFIKRIVESIENKGQKPFIVMDFFAGSGTTAQAVMQLNAEDSGNRQFILVQLPEPLKAKIKEQKAAYDFCCANSLTPNIAEICKERIRRAGQMIKTGKYPDGRLVKDWQPPKNPDLDIGFRVFKIGSSNMREDYYRLPQETDQAALTEKADNIKPGRSAEDLLFQLFLEWGVPLSARIEKEEIDGKEILFVDKSEYVQTNMIACFDKGLTENLLIKLAQMKPLRAVFRDHGFATDSARENLEGIFKQIAPGTDLRVI